MTLMNIYNEVSLAGQKCGKKMTWEPFLKVVDLALQKILRLEVTIDDVESPREEVKSLKDDTTGLFQDQKKKYEDLMEKCKNELFEEKIIIYFYETAIEVGLY